VKFSYAALFAIVLLIILYLSEKALASPWGRMMRAIRDNETAAEAMGKNVTGRHLQVFILGSAVVGIAGAMLTTLDGLTGAQCSAVLSLASSGYRQNLLVFGQWMSLHQAWLKTATFASIFSSQPHICD